MKAAKIKLRVGGEAAVLGEVSTLDPRFIVHKSYSEERGAWTVTHIPTGYAVIRTTSRVKAKAQLRTFLRAVNELGLTKAFNATTRDRVFAQMTTEQRRTLKEAAAQ